MKPAALPENAEFLEVFNLCKRFECLPQSGGLLEQDPDFLERAKLWTAELERWEKWKAERDKQKNQKR